MHIEFYVCFTEPEKKKKKKKKTKEKRFLGRNVTGHVRNRAL